MVCSCSSAGCGPCCARKERTEKAKTRTSSGRALRPDAAASASRRLSLASSSSSSSGGRTLQPTGLPVRDSLSAVDGWAELSVRCRLAAATTLLLLCCAVRAAASRAACWHTAGARFG